jgi:drug/metabolite transporter (DMT)-like permease
MVTVFALCAALLYGSADFLGGAAAKGAHVLSVVMISAGSGIAVLAVAAVLAGGPARSAGIGWGLGAGIAGAVGLIILYAGLATGPMSVVSPVSALVATVLPVGVALADGERPGAQVYAGALLCLIAIVTVSSGGGADQQALTGGGRRPAIRERRLSAGDGSQFSAGHGRRFAAGSWLPGSSRYSRPAAGLAAGYGIASGGSFGLFFLFLRNAGQSGDLWPVLAGRISGITVILLVALAMRQGPVRPATGHRVLLAALGAGVADAAANVCYVAATRAGLFGLAVVLTALYPGVTVLLARVVFGERLRWAQRIGLAVAALGIALVTA